jgi:hypothetical protein
MDYVRAGILTMASSILQGGLLNTTKEEGVLSQSSRSSARGRCLGGIMFFLCPSTDA